MSRPLIIDRVNIRLPRGWRGDATLLARQVAEQLQRQALELRSTDRLDLSLRGPYGGDARRVARQVGEQLGGMAATGKSRRRGA